MKSKKRRRAMVTDRIKGLEELSRKRGIEGKETHFTADYQKGLLELYAELPTWERIARSMAYAIKNQDVFAYDGDRIGGRIYYNHEIKPERTCEELNFSAIAKNEFLELVPEAPELMANQLISGSSFGHITWSFDKILKLGTSGLRAEYERALENAPDEKAEQFYRGVLILIDALDEYNRKHIPVYEKMGNFELAERMKRVPYAPCESFRDAVQAFFMQHIVVMRENPYGGNGPGRLDYYLWPYLERDLKEGRCTLEEAKEIIDELFLRIDERIYRAERWVEAVMVGGSFKDGSSAVNPLTYIMIDSIIDLNIVHPAIYVRIPENPPQELIDAAARYMLSGNNRAQILYDPAVTKALCSTGIPYCDAVEYACGGCMEVGIQGMSSDLLYIGWQNTPKMLELMISGGIDLLTGNRVKSFRKTGGLDSYTDFESFYRDFIEEADRITKIFLLEQDVYSRSYEQNRPAYLISSMVNDCLKKGRNMHGGGARYHEYGGTPLGLPNVADGLHAIKVAVFDKKICTARELMDALKSNYDGYERLQARLKSIPRYGMDNAEADEMAARVMGDFADMYLTYKNRWGGHGKPIILTFVYAPYAAAKLGATPDGRNAHSIVAQGLTPQSSSMTKGVTAAINSCGKVPFEKFSGGASTMWDFDSAYASEPIISALLRSFMEKGGQIFQGNTTPLSELLEAKEHPERFEHLMVRVGGYSARFVNLEPSLQEEVINRIRHSR